MSFVKNQHLKAILGKSVQIHSGRVVGGDYSSRLTGSAVSKARPIAISASILNLFLSSSFHFGSSNFERTISILENRERAISSLMMSPALIVFSEPDIVCTKRNGQTAAKRNEICYLMMERRNVITPALFGFQVVRTLNDDRFGQIPFKGSTVDTVLFRGWCRE